MTNTIQVIENLKMIFHKQKQPFLFVYLFGSLARKDHSESSDLDIAVYVEKNIKQDYFDIKSELYLQLSRALKTNQIDIVVMNQCQNLMLLNNIITHGQLIYEKDHSARVDYEQKIFHRAIDFKHQRKMVMGV
ncbi:MAG: nucleotidyltransferase domain-containing protein [Desulfobacteraceae bacterium]|nr:nucleotidyltransferase domain-containing protein [Desulfobacteraceae bacterium]